MRKLTEADFKELNENLEEDRQRFARDFNYDLTTIGYIAGTKV